MSTKPPYSQSLELQNARARVKELESALMRLQCSCRVGTATELSILTNENEMLRLDIKEIKLFHHKCEQQLTSSRELNQKMFEALEMEQFRFRRANADTVQDLKFVETPYDTVLELARSQGFGKEKV